MNKIRSLLLAAALATPAFAITWTDTTNGQPLKFLEGNTNNSSSSYSSTFNITDNGYNPATMVVTAATATFWFADDSNNDGGEQVQIFVNGVSLIASLEVDGLHPESNFAQYSFSLNSANDVNGLIAALQDGIISYKVQLLNGSNSGGSNAGDTYLKIASLSVTGQTRSVPDSGMTVVMLGLGLAGLVAARNRFGIKL